METVAEFLVAGMKLAALDSAPMRLPVGARDMISGQVIEMGYNLWDIVPDTAGEYLDLLGGTAGYLSEASARAFGGCWNMGSWMIFEDGTGYHPLINRQAAREQGRPCWSELARQVWRERQGERMVCIVTTDFKKRLWTRARVGVLGKNSDVYLYDPEQNIGGNFKLNWEVMIEYLDAIEGIYNAGHSKPAMMDNLLREWQKTGLAQAGRYEKTLAAMRGTPEFAFSILAAQRDEEKNERKTK